MILLTATPINTAYRDISTQLALVTHEQGNIGGYSIEQIKQVRQRAGQGTPGRRPPTGS